ncbi:retrovirus-related pol polyprotein from transposon TNT 1-94 [Tanacetum coccineum]
MEKIFQIFQDLRFDISFADALLLMPRFAPTIRNLLMNKENLLELAKIPLNENCSVMLLKKLPEKLGDPGNTTPLSDSSPSLTSFETNDSLLEEFADELALLDPFPPRNEDVKADLREIKLLLISFPYSQYVIESQQAANSVNSSEPILSSRPTAVEVPKELLKIKPLLLLVDQAFMQYKEDKNSANTSSTQKNKIRNVMISRVYYIEGLGHNLFSVGQFCNSNLEDALPQHTYFIHNLEGVDLLTRSRGNNLYTLSLGDMMASSHISRHGLVRGLPKLKFEKEHLCSACAMGKSKKKPYKPKSDDTNQEKLYLLHMDLCGPMRVASVNGKKYILVIVDDYSRFTWVKCLRSKDEAPDFIFKFLKMIQVRLRVPVRRIRTDNGTEFVNQTLREYYEKVGISHET